MAKMKTKRVRKLKIRYIPGKHFDKDGNNIIGATSFLKTLKMKISFSCIKRVFYVEGV